MRNLSFIFFSLIKLIYGQLFSGQDKAVVIGLPFFWLDFHTSFLVELKRIVRLKDLTFRKNIGDILNKN
jgi:hypothetical protein